MKRILTAALAVGLTGAAWAGALGVHTQSDQAPAELVLASFSNSKAEQRFAAYVTGYSYWDNTPPGSAEISKPVIHRKAGGRGTYNDPITIAVGHVIEGGRQTLDFQKGTRFYIARLRKYAIVEDVCGDGNRPQDGPCHTGFQGRPWLDIYIEGARVSAAAATQCANQLTAVQQVIINPQPNYAVDVGPIAESGCRVYR
ncbi:MAG: hypothetical protein P8X50_04255 [Maritimibacter sp.]|jgi:hypothetical protein